MSGEIDKVLILNRIKDYYKFETDAEFADFLGVKPNTLSNWRSRNTIDYELIFTKCEDINLNWLLTGHGRMAKSKKDYTLSPTPELVNDTSHEIAVPRHKSTPLLNAEAFGGMGNSTFAIEEKDIQALYVVPDFENVDFMIRVKGSSMYPKYNSGDVVACRILKERSFIQWNKVHVIATHEQGILIKRLKKGPDPKTVTAISDNKDYDPFDVPWDEITGIALVVGVIRVE